MSEVKLEVDARGSREGHAESRHPPQASLSNSLKVRIGPKSGQARIAALKLEDASLDISPRSPLVSTALHENGWVCGRNTHGQLGVPHTDSIEHPQALTSLRWKAISLGEAYAAGVADGGEVYTWGCNDKGQLGAVGGPRAGTWDVPKRMDLLFGWDVRGIACGAGHTVAITPSDVITWGSNQHGQCGHGERAETEWVKPRSLKALHGQLVTQIVCGKHHTLCATATAVVFAWGCNTRGQLGLGDTKSRRSPTPVSPLWALPVQQLAAGHSHSAALTSNGFLFTWGDNVAGQLGLPPAADSVQLRSAAAAPSAAGSMATPSSSGKEMRRSFRRVNQRFLQAMGEMGIDPDQAELALAETGNVSVEVATEWLFSAGADVIAKRLSGEADVGSPTASLDAVSHEQHLSGCVTVPRRVPLQGVRSVSAGRWHTVAVTDNDVYSWGENTSGQLGLGTTQTEAHPGKIAFLSGKGVCQVAAGARHTLFLCRDGSIYGAGDSTYGALPVDPSEQLKGMAIASSVDHKSSVSVVFGRSSNLDDANDDDDDSSSNDYCSAVAGSDNSSFWAPSPATTTGLQFTTPVLLDLSFLATGKNVKSTVVTAVAAGCATSAFLTRGADELPDPPALRLWQRLQHAVAGARAAPTVDLDAHITPIAAAVERVFGCSAAISAAFGLPDAVGLDAELLEAVQTDILSLEPPAAAKLGDPQPERNELHSALRRGADVLIRELEENIGLLGTPERAQVVLALTQSQLLCDSRCSNSVIPRVCNIVLAAPASCRHLLVKWWAEYPSALLETRVVAPLQRYLTDELFATKKLTVAVMNAIKVLAQVEEANQLGRQLPPEVFYNELISEKLDVLDHYVAWRQSHDMPQLAGSADGPFSFCSYPFLLNPRAKSKLLHTEARIQMDQTVADARNEQAGNSPELLEERILPPLPPKPVSPQRNPYPPNNNNNSSNSPRRQSPATSSAADGGLARAGRRRRDRGAAGSSGGGLRWLLGRHADTATSSYLSDSSEDDRYPSPGLGSPGLPPLAPPGSDLATPQSRLWKQGSLGLPSPEESNFPAYHAEMCILRVRRGHLMEDALCEVARQRPRDLFKPLRVHFIGEDGVDAGGVKKEFFQLLMTELLTPDHGMLTHQHETNTYWFNPCSLEPEEDFLLLGLIVGLAVYNGVLLDFPLPIALYRKILGQDVKLRDLEEVQPTLGKSLRSLLDWEGPGSVADVFCQTFAVDVEFAGETRTVALVPNGETTAVTEENRRAFVDTYVDWWLNASCHRQFESFAKGFLTLCGGPALQLFSATELERLVCGSPCLDFEAMTRSARYEGGYHPEHRVVLWLWDVVRELTPEERKMFLKFFTGTDRAPIGGLANLKMVVQRDGPDSNKLPRSHTCFNTLLLPSYRSKDKLADRLKLAILNAEGFGLE